MKVLTVVGARPQFIKAAPVSRALRRVATEVLVHTGQHFDANMSDVFFEELGIPAPDHHLGIGGGSHGVMTGAMLARLEEVILAERPDRVLVYGDTNSTLAGALAAVKLHVPVAHVEAGLRSFNRRMPEEINRIMADHVSDLLFAPTASAVQWLAAEGITRGVHEVGDVMLDAVRMFLPRAEEHSDVRARLDLEPGGYYLATIHRAENTDDPERLRELLMGLGRADRPVIWPMHPRTRGQLTALGLELPPTVRAVGPAGYLDMLQLQRGAAAVLTDSGGVQKEACFLGVPCITLREETEWTETVEQGWNVLVGADANRLHAAMTTLKRPGEPVHGFGDGRASDLIAGLVAQAGD